MNKSLNSLEKIFSQTKSAAEFSRAYLDRLASMLERIDEHAIERVVTALQEARSAEQSIFLIGNGGSAATASHFANDLAVGTRSTGQPYRAVCLADNMSAITSIANDYGYEHVFAHQLQNQARAGDVLIAISASGNSPNIVNAMELAAQMGCVTVGITGFDGGRVKSMAQIVLHVPSDNGEYGPVEDVHMVFDHVITNYLMLQCRLDG